MSKHCAEIEHPGLGFGGTWGKLQSKVPPSLEDFILKAPPFTKPPEEGDQRVRSMHEQNGDTAPAYAKMNIIFSFFIKGLQQEIGGGGLCSSSEQD